ncbi:MAG: hypothetical protein FJ291_32175, partial [Planctomycetes bacterium]|nr:hypothetical protein [Planctomycetota bacterium]
MNRREFLAMGLSAAAFSGPVLRTFGAEVGPAAPDIPNSPATTKLNIKPVMTSILHTAKWEGPCRWTGVDPAAERRGAEQWFARWARELREGPLGQSPELNLLEPAHITFSEKFVLTPAELRKLGPDGPSADVLYLIPAGSSLSAFEVGKHLGKPILLKGLGCRNVDIAAYTRAMGAEALVVKDDADFAQLIRLLRARKVFRQTTVLFPTDRGLPAVCSVGSVWDLDGLRKRLGVSVKTISYKRLSAEMERVLASAPAADEAKRATAELLKNADRSFIDAQYVARSMLFYRALRELMARQGCNAFTIECFEFCSSRLPERWTITPCLIHALLRNQQCASSCEADLGSLLAMRMLMSVAARSCHQGNSDPAGPDTFRINHSSTSMKMNGFDKPGLPYQLGRFVSQGWGTKVALNFLDNPEKTVTVARVNPLATKLLVLKGQLVGASGWGKDLIGCSVEAVIKPPEGR